MLFGLFPNGLCSRENVRKESVIFVGKAVNQPKDPKDTISACSKIWQPRGNF